MSADLPLMDSIQEQSHDHQEGKRCLFCGRFFNPRRGGRQKVCLDPVCQKARKRAQERAWIERYRQEKGESYYQGGYERVQEWRKRNPGYQRRWRAGRRAMGQGEIHNAHPSADPIKSLLLRIRIPSALRFSEIQTLNLQMTRSGSGFSVDGYP